MKNSQAMILFIALLAIGALMLVVLVMNERPRRSNFDWAHNYLTPPPILSGIAPMPSPTPTTTEPVLPIEEVLDSSGRQTYKNAEYGFELKFLKGWKILKEINTRNSFYPILLWVSFGTGIYGSEGYDGELFALVYDKQLMSTEEIIEKSGKQFSDRIEKRQKIIINGIPAIKFTVTTASIPDWVFNGIILEQGEYIYLVISGTDKSVLFEVFYNSFKFLK